MLQRDVDVPSTQCRDCGNNGNLMATVTLASVWGDLVLQQHMTTDRLDDTLLKIDFAHTEDCVLLSRRRFHGEHLTVEHSNLDSMLADL
jgi:hypothetical protein